MDFHYPYTSMVDAFVDHARKTPDKIFLIDKDTPYTYFKCFRIAYGYALFLKEQGVKEGDCVVVKTSQSAATVLCDMAIGLLSAVYVPLEKAIAADRASFIVETTESALFISDKEMEVNAKFLNLKEIYDHEADIDAVPDDLVLPAPDSINEILFTTGTTGTSKGVTMSQIATVRTAENVAVAIGIQDDDVEVIPSPINHAFGLRRYYAVLLAGGAVIILDGVIFINNLWKAFDKHGATGMAIVPAMLAVIFKLSKDKLGDYADRIRYIQIGGAVLPPTDKAKLCELLPNSRLYDFYGCSEAGCACTADYNIFRDKQKSLGKPTINAHFRLLCEDGTVAEYPTTNAVGLLSYGGSFNMNGYWKEPELTRETIIDGHVVTKDLAYFDEDGFVYLIGRQDDVITTAGFKVAPTEIEEVAMGCPLISDCAVIGVPDELAGSVPKMFVVPPEGQELDAVGINNYLLDKLEAYKAPKYIVQIDAIPRTYNGKILRRELKELG